MASVGNLEPPYAFYVNNVASSVFRDRDSLDELNRFRH